jgi:uncharacterized protein (DUF924 family)
MSLVRSVLEFWFGAPGSAEHGRAREVWFRQDPAFDAEIRRHFAKDAARAARGEHDRLLADAEGALALVIMLDQFPRNLYRGDPKTYAADAKARLAADHAIGARFDERARPVERQFFYLPFMHSEQAQDQDRSVELYRRLAEAEPGLANCHTYALRHRDIIRRFGRFPHRNAVLGRETSEAELAFLKEPGLSF